jgi:tetratricopeptide (TPR) repeat protein
LPVFISYSSADQAWAEAVCDSLEARGFPCWIAPRNISPGANWSESILRGISECDVFLLILSSNSNHSQQVERELETAVRRGRAILPLRLQNLPLSKGIQFYIGDTRSLDAFAVPQETLWDDLASAVSRLLNRGGPPPPPRARRTRFTTLQWSMLLLISLILSISTLYAFAQLYPVVQDRLNPREPLNEPEQIERISKKYYEEGVRQFDTGDYENAIQSFDKALTVDPTNSSIYNYRGQAYSKTKNYESAIRDYSNAITLDQNNPQYYNNRGKAFKATGHHQEAVSDYTAALDLDPKYKEALENRAESYRVLGEKEKALQDYDQLIQLNPQAQVHFERAVLEHNLEQYALAIGDYSRAIRLQPNFPKAYNGRGLCHQASGNLPSAISDFTKAIQQDPAFADAYCNRGYARILAGDPIRAQKDFDTCGKLEPSRGTWIKKRLNEEAQKKSKSVIKKLGDKIKKIF